MIIMENQIARPQSHQSLLQLVSTSTVVGAWRSHQQGSSRHRRCVAPSHRSAELCDWSAGCQCGALEVHARQHSRLPEGSNEVRKHFYAAVWGGWITAPSLRDIWSRFHHPHPPVLEACTTTTTTQALFLVASTTPTPPRGQILLNSIATAREHRQSKQLSTITIPIFLSYRVENLERVLVDVLNLL